MSFLLICFFALFILEASAAGNLTAEQIKSFYDPEKIAKEPLNVKILDKKEVSDGKTILEEVEFTSEKTERGEYRIFAYYAYPKDLKDKIPGQLFIMGGMAPGEAKDAIEGAAHGYATITIHQPSSGGRSKSKIPSFPGWGESWSLFPVSRHEKLSDWWLYHSCAALMRAITFLQSRPEVDQEIIAVRGQSWGGFLTVMISGIDKRIKAAVPVFGCGFFENGTYWNDSLEKMSPENRKDWLMYFDPGAYAFHIECPVLYMTASNDWAYWLNSFIRTYQAMPSGNKRMAIYVNGSHDVSSAMHNDRWKWMDLYCKKTGKDFPDIKKVNFKANKDKLDAEIAIDSSSPVTAVEIAYSEGDNDVPPSRYWSTVKAAKSDNGNWRAEIPVYFTDIPIYFFANVTDKDGHFVSSVPASVIPMEHGVGKIRPPSEQPVITADKDLNFGNGAAFKAVRTHAWVEKKDLGKSPKSAVCEYDPEEKFYGGKVLKADCANHKELELTREPQHYALKFPEKDTYLFSINLKSDKNGQKVYLGLYNNRSGKYFSKPVELSVAWKPYQVELIIPEDDTEGLLAKIFIPAEDADSNIWLSGYSLSLK